MVEEIHSLEQQHDSCKGSGDSADKPRDYSGEKQAAAPPAHVSPSKRSRVGYTQLPGHVKDPLNFSAAHQRAGMAGSLGGGVSLTLGLHQNGGNICFSDQAVAMPLAAVHRYSMEDGGGLGFAMDGGHLFGKEFDGQLHHVF